MTSLLGFVRNTGSSVDRISANS